MATNEAFFSPVYLQWDYAIHQVLIYCQFYNQKTRSSGQVDDYYYFNIFFHIT